MTHSVLIRDRVQEARRPQDGTLRADWWALGVGAAIALLMIGGMAVGLAPVTLVGALGAFGVAVLWPMAGLTILAMTAPLVPPPVIPSPGFGTVLALALLFGCILRLPIERPRFAPAAPLVVVVVFVTYVFAQQVPAMIAGWSDEAGIAAGYHFIEIFTGAVAICAAGLILRDRSPFPILAAVLISALVAALLAILAGGEPAAAPAMLRNLLGVSGDEGRAMGPFVNPNYFGTFMAMALTLLAALALAVQSFQVRLALAGLMPVLAVGLLLSMSRGAMVTLLVGLTAVAFARSLRLGFATAATGALLVLIAYPVFLEWRLANENAGVVSTAVYLNQSDSDDSRFGVLATVPAVFERSPLLGVGPGQFPLVSAEVTPGGVEIETHNWYLQVLAEQGIVGFTIWLALLVSLAFALAARPRAPRIVGMGMLAALAACSLFLQPPASYQFSAMPLLVLAASLVPVWPPPSARSAPDRASTSLGERRPASRPARQFT